MRQSQSVSVSVPGKIMLAGEYAILRRGRSLSAAVDARLRLDISPSDSFRISSDLWPQERTLPSSPSDEPLIDSLQWSAARFELDSAYVEVQSDLDVSFGLGSSSAVRLAAHLGLAAFALQTVALSSDQRWEAARDAWILQRRQQGFASGYDLVTQVQGGFIEWAADYGNWPGSVRNLDMKWLAEWIHPYAGGAGAPTKQIGGSVRSWLDQSDLWAELLIRSDALIEAFLSQRPERFIDANRVHRDLFQNSPFYPVSIDKTLASLRGFDRSWTFKTTGAGGEDAILLIGQASDLREADQQLRRTGWLPLASGWTEQGSDISWKEAAL